MTDTTNVGPTEVTVSRDENHCEVLLTIVGLVEDTPLTLQLPLDVARELNNALYAEVVRLDHLGDGA